ncbi:hypothetical protein DEAC_c35640 [Desulfosporosinus acididurans]|uniref:Uncharacterized protein n=1 Tax=Desulfosporosinus acididurans TaxID=476652 RepID=A0A0J1FMQ6_9FIRM|nr:hypothetical protein DEAC_c35640 [Desulfosporosinus acididurans]
MINYLASSLPNQQTTASILGLRSKNAKKALLTNYRCVDNAFFRLQNFFLFT